MAMSKAEKAKYEAEWKKAKNIKKGEVITPGALIRGAAKVVAKVTGETAAEKASVKVGQKTGQKIAEAIKPNKYPSAGGKTKTIKTEGRVTVKGKSGSTSTTPSSSSVTATKTKISDAQRRAIAKASETKRAKAIVGGAKSAKEAAKPVIKKAVKQRNVVAGGLAAYIGIDKGNDLRKKKK
jgi:hypothetical protein